MTIAQLITLATKGDLKGVSTKDRNDVVLGYLNLGLIELYKRFPIKTEEVIITLGQDGTVTDPYTMISDTVYQMPDDYLYVVSAYDEIPEFSLDEVNPIPINEEDNMGSINTISWNRIQVPTSVAGANISVIYAASPTYFTEEDLEEGLPLPAQMYEALLHYMAFKAHSSVVNSGPEAQVLYQQFEQSVQNIRTYGLFSSDDMSMADRIKNRTFV